MCGGGTPQMPAQESEQSRAQARQWEADQTAARDARAAAELKAQQAADKAAADAKWTSGRSSAFDKALNYGNSRLSSMGVDPTNDPYGIGELYRSRIGSNNAALQVGDDYTSAFSPTTFDDVAGEVRSGQRNKMTQNFNSLIDPYYADSMFGSTADDAIMSAILGSQYNDAEAGIKTARDRGQINNVAYDRAISDLGGLKTTANADLQNIGGGVLSGISSELGKRRSNVTDKIAGWDFGSDLDLGRESDRIKSYANERLGGLEGDIRSALGNKSYFDVNSILGKASAKAGNETAPAAGAGTSALSNALSNSTQKKNEGVF